MATDALEKAALVIENRVREQIERTFSHTPNADPHKVIELQIRFERERLQQRLSKLMDAEDVDEKRETALRWLIDEFLPEQERKLKIRLKTR